MVVCPYQVIGTCLGSGIGASWIIGGSFQEESFAPQGAIYLIGGNMIEKFPRKVFFPCTPACIQEIDRTDYVGADKGKRIKYGAVNMRFRCKMDNGIRPVLRKQSIDEFSIDNIPLDKGIIVQVFQVFQVLKVACICKRIQVQDPVFQVFRSR